MSERDQGQAGGAVTALVLDDSRFDRAHLIRLLRRAGLTVQPTEVADLAGFAEALDRGPYDLVFLDYTLAGDETGLDAVTLLARHPLQAHAAPIMVTGRGQLEVAVTAMRMGCVDYLVKDQLDAATLRRAIATGVERRLLALAIAGDGEARSQAVAALTRFDSACIEELHRSMRSLLERAQGLRSRADDRATFFEDVAAIETTCERIWGLMGELGAEPAEAPRVTPRRRARSPAE